MTTATWPTEPEPSQPPPGLRGVTLVTILSESTPSKYFNPPRVRLRRETSCDGQENDTETTSQNAKTGRQNPQTEVQKMQKEVPADLQIHGRRKVRGRIYELMTISIVVRAARHGHTQTTDTRSRIQEVLTLGISHQSMVRTCRTLRLRLRSRVAEVRWKTKRP